MPRKSAAELSVARLVEVVPRPNAPQHLEDDQAEIWEQVVSHQEAGWFSASNLPLLEMYCRHIAASRKIAQLIADREGGRSLDIEEYDRLLKMQEREGRAASSLATRMRLTQQAIHDRTKKNKAEIDDNPLSFGRG